MCFFVFVFALMLVVNHTLSQFPCFVDCSRLDFNHVDKALLTLMGSIHLQSINPYTIYEGSRGGLGPFPADNGRKVGTTHSHSHIYGHYRVTNSPNLPVFGLWEETGVPGGNSLNKVFYFIFSLSFQYSKYVVAYCSVWCVSCIYKAKFHLLT